MNEYNCWSGQVFPVVEILMFLQKVNSYLLYQELIVRSDEL